MLGSVPSSSNKYHRPTIRCQVADLALRIIDAPKDDRIGRAGLSAGGDHFTFLELSSFSSWLYPPPGAGAAGRKCIFPSRLGGAR